MKISQIINESKHGGVDPRATTDRIRAIQAELKQSIDSARKTELRAELEKLVADMETWQKAMPVKESTELLEAADESWVQAYQALEANGGEPTLDKPTLFLKQIAMLVKDAGLADTVYGDRFVPSWEYSDDIKNKAKQLDQIKQYLKNYVQTDRLDSYANMVQKMLQTRHLVPTVTQMKQYSQQSQAQTTQFQQQQAVSALRHDLSMQELVRKNQLDAADTEAVLAMDVEARQAILAKKQEMDLEAKERLAKVEMDIRASKEPEAERAQALEIARANNAHELEVIRLTAEGEYKKAKLEADYQIQIKQLENIDNAEERQNKLDVINTNKAKEIAIINAETRAKIQGLEAETTAERESSNIRVQEAFMTTFKPIWGSLVQRASELGKTLSQSISAVTGALERLGKPVMPQAQKPTESVDPLVRIRQLAGK